MTELKKQVEAILFAASKRMTAEELLVFLPDSSLSKISSSLEELKSFYDSSDTSLTLSVYDNSWKISLKDAYLPLAEKLMPSTDLSKPIIETLAIIAWKNPILQSDLVKIRSPTVYDHIGELEKLKLVTRAKKGRSYVLKVTDKFYDYFDTPQYKADELFGQYVEPEKKPIIEESNVFNKGDSFDESVDERDKRLIQEIKNNKIDPTAIIREDKEFLENFDKRLHDIEAQSSNATEILKDLDSIEKKNELILNAIDTATITELEKEEVEISANDSSKSQESEVPPQDLPNQNPILHTKKHKEPPKSDEPVDDPFESNDVHDIGGMRH